jgi:transmembrane sensor
MTVTTEQTGINEAAAAWDVRLRSVDCSPEERARFDAWLAADARHQAIFERLQAGLATLRAAADRPQMRALREVAGAVERRAINHHATRKWVLAAGIAVAALFVTWHPHFMEDQLSAGALRGAVPIAARGEFIETSATERRTVALPDGSTISVDSASRVATEWLPDERRIHLLAGHVLFRVAKDMSRPFIVTAGDRTVTALGTEFDVRVEPDRVRVTLIEGRVAVRGLGVAANLPVQQLKPRDQLIALSGQVAMIQRVDTVHESAWADGQVYFSDEDLPNAVAEMNRHSVRQITIGDPALQQYRVNGMFRAANQDSFLNAITSYYPIDARQDKHGQIVLRQRGGASAPH